MPQLSRSSSSLFVVGWLFVATLVAFLGWRAYENEIKPWEEGGCQVLEASVVDCRPAGGYRIRTQVILHGATRNTSDTECGFDSVKAAEAAAARLKAEQPLTCYMSPRDGTITLDRTKAEKTSAQKRTALILTVAPLVITVLASATVLFVVVKFSRLLPNMQEEGVLGSVLGMRRPPQRFSATRGLSDEEADIAIEELSIATTANDAEIPVCVVCLDNTSRKAVVLPCTHTFHTACLKEWWMKGSPVCPCCSSTVDDLRSLRHGEASGAASAQPTVQDDGVS